MYLYKHDCMCRCMHVRMYACKCMKICKHFFINSCLHEFMMVWMPIWHTWPQACMNAHMHDAWMHACIFLRAHTHAWMHGCMHAYLYAHMHVYMDVRAWAHICMCKYIHVCMSTHVCIPTHACTYARMYSCAHTCMCRCTVLTWGRCNKFARSWRFLHLH